jgi:hypothetical protein
MTMAKDGRLVALYECGETNAYEEIRLALVTLK